MDPATLGLLRTVFEVRISRSYSWRAYKVMTAMVSSLSYKFFSSVSRGGASPALGARRRYVAPGRNNH
jgi:hypothetical protein